MTSRGKESSKFAAISQAYIYVISQENAPNFVCDPKTTFTTEVVDGKIFLCKHVDSIGDGGTAHKVRMDGCTLGPPLLDMPLYLHQFRPVQDKILSLASDAGVSSSVWLLGKHYTQLNCSMLFNEQQENDMFRATLSSLFARLAAPTAQLSEFMRLSWSVHIKCFEVVGDQIIDLLLAPPLTPTRGGGGRAGCRAAAPKVFEHPQQGAVVAGLTRRRFKNAADAHSSLRQAHSRRLVLVAESCVGSTRNVFGQRVLGTVGCVFIQIELEQVLYPVQLAARGNFDQTFAFKYNSTIQFNIMADFDALSFKPSREDSVSFLPLDAFLQPGGRTEEGKGQGQGWARAPLASSALANSHKALAALSRVLRRLLHRQEGTRAESFSGDAVPFIDELLSASAASPSPRQQFVPFRDSVLTRVLQPSLEGGFVNLVYLCVGSDSNASVAHGLRTATELRALLQYVYRHKTELFEEVQSPVAMPVKFEEVSGPFVGQGKRQLVTALRSEQGRERSGQPSQEEGGGEEEEEEEKELGQEGGAVYSEEAVEQSFWDTLARLQQDHDFVTHSAEHLATLEAQRQELFENLNIASVEKDSPLAVVQRQLSVPHISVDVELLTRGGAARAAQAGAESSESPAAPRPLQQRAMSLPPCSPPSSPSPASARSPALGSLSSPPSRTSKWSAHKSISFSDHRPSLVQHSAATMAGIKTQPGPVLTPPRLHSCSFDPRAPSLMPPLSNADREAVGSRSQPLTLQVDAMIPSRPQLPPRFSGSFPSDRLPGNSPGDSSCMVDIFASACTASPYAFDNAAACNNAHLDNPTSFIDIYERQQQQHEKALHAATAVAEPTPPRPSSATAIARATTAAEVSNSPVATGLLSGKNIWSSSQQQPGNKTTASRLQSQSRHDGSSQCRRLLSDELHSSDGEDDDNTRLSAAQHAAGRAVAVAVAVRGAGLLTVPDLGLNAAEAKVLTRSLSSAFPRGKPQGALLPLRPSSASSHAQEDSRTTLSPIRVSVMKMRSKQNITDELSDDDADVALSRLENAFLHAVARSNLGAVRKHVSQGVNVLVKNSFGRDAMQIAARNGDLDMLKYLVWAGASTETRGKGGDTLFHLAGANGHVYVLQWLAAQGLMHTTLDMHGQSVAHVAARRGEAGVLHYLHEHLHMGLSEQDFAGLGPLQLVPKRALHGCEAGLAETRRFLESLQRNGES